MSSIGLIDQLVEYYYKYEEFQDAYMSEEKITDIFRTLMLKNRLHTFLDGDKLLGFGESFRLSFEQFGHLICGENFYPKLKEMDIETGPIAVLMQVTIHPDYRNTTVIKMLRNDFFTKNYACDYFCGTSRTKKSQPVKVFTRAVAFEKWVNKRELQEAL